MIKITAWNDGYETHDSRRSKGRLLWVRQTILMGDVSWAKLWMREDAAQVWAGWTAIVWCAAQSDERGSISSAEDVSILSRVPIEMIEMALEWGISCGFVDLEDNRAVSAQPARNLRADCATTGRDETGRDGTLRDATGRDIKQTSTETPREAKKNREWPAGLSPSTQPTREVFLEAVSMRFPSWQPKAVGAVYDRWRDNRWEDGNGVRIGNWQALAAIWYARADQTDKFEKLPLGEATREVIGDGIDAVRMP